MINIQGRKNTCYHSASRISREMRLINFAALEEKRYKKDAPNETGT